MVLGPFLTIEILIGCVFLRVGLVEEPKEHFWTYIAEYPAHDKSIPPALENQFLRELSYGEREGSTYPPITHDHLIQFLSKAQQKTKENRVFPLDGSQIETVIRQYNYLKGMSVLPFSSLVVVLILYPTAGQAQGNQKATACIAWIMGVVMPLNELTDIGAARISDDLILALTRVHI